MSVTLTRPLPPLALVTDPTAPSFVPATELEAWARATFIEEGATLENPEHAHLRVASLGFLWATVSNSRHGRGIAGQCEMMPPMAMGKWARARAEQQIEDWFGAVPDFLITLDAHYSAQASDAEFCALVEHELLHAGQAKDRFGAPAFTREGRPKFTLRGHDVEEFVSIVRRYGTISGDVRALVDAAKNRPEVAPASVAQACGTCQLRAA